MVIQAWETKKTAIVKQDTNMNFMIRCLKYYAPPKHLSVGREIFLEDVILEWL